MLTCVEKVTMCLKQDTKANTGDYRDVKVERGIFEARIKNSRNVFKIVDFLLILTACHSIK